MNWSLLNWRSRSRRKSFKSLGAGNRANTRNTVSWENRILQPSNRSIQYFPSGPSRTRPRSRLRSWSTQAPHWWQSLEGYSASFLAFLLSLFGTISGHWKDFFVPKIKHSIEMYFCAILDLYPSTFNYTFSQKCFLKGIQQDKYRDSKLKLLVPNVAVVSFLAFLLPFGHPKILEDSSAQQIQARSYIPCNSLHLFAFK